MLSQGGAGARAVLGRAGGGGTTATGGRALTGLTSMTQTTHVERVVSESGAHPPVSALSCQSPFNSRQCHNIGTRPIPHWDTTRAPILTLPALFPHPDTAAPSLEWLVLYSSPHSNKWGSPKPSLSVLACLTFPQSSLRSFTHPDTPECLWCARDILVKSVPSEYSTLGSTPTEASHLCQSVCSCFHPTPPPCAAPHQISCTFRIVSAYLEGPDYQAPTAG